MLTTIAVILLVLWLLGFVTSLHPGRLYSHTPGSRDHHDLGSTHQRGKPDQIACAVW
jgi:hypothetical protein